MDYEIEPNESVSMAVVRAVSATDGTDPCSLPQLANQLDPDALDALFESDFKGTPRKVDHISFDYAGYGIAIDNGENLTVRPLRRGNGGYETDESNP